MPTKTHSEFETLGYYLKHLRTINNQTLTTVAKFCFPGRNGAKKLSKIENGLQRIKKEDLNPLAKSLGVEEKTLLSAFTFFEGGRRHNFSPYADVDIRPVIECLLAKNCPVTLSMIQSAIPHFVELQRLGMKFQA